MGAVNPYLTRAMSPDGSRPATGAVQNFMQAPQIFNGGNYRQDGQFSGGDALASIFDPMGIQRASGSGNNSAKGALLGPIARLF